MNTFHTFSYDDYWALSASDKLQVERGPEGLIYTPDSRYFADRDTAHKITFLACLSPLTQVGLYKTKTGRDSRQKTMRHRLLGIAELQVSPYDEQEVWLKYISVHAQHQGRSIGRTLADMVVDVMLENGKQLRRSSSSDLAIAKGFQYFMDKLLDERGVTWTQSGRDKSFGM